MGLKSKFLRNLKYVLLLLFFFALTGWGLYTAISPNVETYIKEQDRTQAIYEYREENDLGDLGNIEMWEQTQIKIKAPEETPEVFPELWEVLRNYNEQIYAEGQVNLTDPFAYAQTAINLSEYGYNSEVFGVVNIPKLNVELPIYLGASERNMDSGAAQMTETSMPIGGENTNSVLAVHRNYVMEVEELEKGDVILVQNPWEVLEYRVVQIELIWPHEVEYVMIQENQDLITIMTCHPWGSGGKYRYVVIAERYKEEVNEETVIQITLPSTDGIKDRFEKIFTQWKNEQNTDLEISEGTEFTSSRRDILIRKYLPVTALWVGGAASFVLILAQIIRLLRRKTKSRN